MRFFTFLVAMVMLSAVVEASIITDPGLANGSPFRVVFATADRVGAGGIRDATSTNIADYNTFVNNIGTSLTWEGNVVSGWTAIGSTATVDAIDNTMTPVSTPSIPVYLISGVLVASDYAQLWSGTLLSRINVAPDYGGAASTVWTGSTSLGRASGSDFLGGSGAVTEGAPSVPSSGWIIFGSFNPTVPAGFYGISPVLTVGGASSPVPEPSAFLLFVLCAAGGCVAYRHRKRKGLELHSAPNSANA